MGNGQRRWYSAVTARRQSRQRQSSKPVGLGSPGFGNGSLIASAPHQQGPCRLQANAAPQRAQVSCLGLESGLATFDPVSVNFLSDLSFDIRRAGANSLPRACRHGQPP
ncbi:hypothetical protein X566_12945 [Afipia sp. P52-10]|jgi:hypothetical protein|nr:hypothetical protein X566_12945 [Afipia sp. P52-10]